MRCSAATNPGKYSTSWGSCCQNCCQGAGGMVARTHECWDTRADDGGVRLSPISTKLLLSCSHEEPRNLGSFVRISPHESVLVRPRGGQNRGQLKSGVQDNGQDDRPDISSCASGGFSPGHVRPRT